MFLTPVPLLIALLAGPTAALAQEADSNGSAATVASYTETQAARGATAFRQNCQSCHSSKQFVGTTFDKARSGRPLFEFFDQIRTAMPQDEPGRLTAQQYTDIIVYLLKENAYPVGKDEIPANDDVLKKLQFRTVK